MSDLSSNLSAQRCFSSPVSGFKGLTCHAQPSGALSAMKACNVTETCNSIGNDIFQFKDS